MHKRGLGPTESVPASGSIFKNFYRNVGAQLGVDPETVIRVALGEQRSRKIEAAMERELIRIADVPKSDRNGSERRVVRIDPTKRDLGLPVFPGLPV
jgi:hypothetical protein